MSNRGDIADYYGRVYELAGRSSDNDHRNWVDDIRKDARKFMCLLVKKPGIVHIIWHYLASTVQKAQLI